MLYKKTVPTEEIRRCMICADAPCTAACPHDLPAGDILRSLLFDNEIGAARRLPAEDVCARCDAPCERACLHMRRPVAVKEVLAALRRDRADMEVLPDTEVDLSATCCGVRLENPFLLASSVVASSYEKIARAFDKGWAGVSFKTICDFIPRETSPRYAAVGGGGSFYGFKNVEQLSTNTVEQDLDIIRRLKRDYPGKVIIASIMGRDAAEWERLARLTQEAGADVIECNFSCPNMEQGGLGVDIGQDPELVGRFTAAARRGCTIPLMAKLTPNVASMQPMARAAKANGADGIAAINTIKSIMGMNLDTYVTAPSVRGVTGEGGYSGRAVKPIAERFVWELAADRELGLPISGMGGIETWRDAMEFLLLGAENVQITTAVMECGARIIDDLLDGLTLYLREKGVGSVKELIGLGVENVKPLDALERGSILYPKFLREKCVGCGRCVVSCADGGHEALTLKDRKPVMNGAKCVGCHLCVLVCPNQAIRPSGVRKER